MPPSIDNPSMENQKLLSFSSLRFKLQMETAPELQLDLSGSTEALCIELNRQEIIHGLRQTFSHFKMDALLTKLPVAKHFNKKTLLRRLPNWVRICRFEAVESSMHIAGVDVPVGKDARGVSIMVGKAVVEYRCFQMYQHHQSHYSRKYSSREPSGEILSPGGPQHSNSPFSPKPSEGWDNKGHVFPDFYRWADAEISYGRYRKRSHRERRGI